MSGRHLLAVLLSMVAANSLRAGTHYVDLNSTNPVSPFTTWATAATNIQDAVDTATNGDTVLVTNGIYQAGGRVIFGMLTNRVAIPTGVNVQSVNGPAVTIIKGRQVPVTTNGPGAVRCVSMTNGAMLAGFTLTGGGTSTQPGGNNPLTTQSGGGVWCPSTNMIISNCIITGNTANNNGGGAYQGTFISCTFSSNWAANTGGAAFYSSIPGLGTTGTMRNCVLSNNAATNEGGGVYNCFVYDSTITGNFTLGQGGGAGESTLNNCVVSGNTSSNQNGGDGGGVYSCTLTNCTVSGNTAGGLGAGAYGSSLRGCVLSGNSAPTINGLGGAGYSCTFNNCILSNNYAATGGGARTGNLTNCVIVNNSAVYGGGVYQVTLANCLVVSNTATTEAGGVYSSTLYNCTVAGNSSPGDAGGVRSCTSYNSIIQSNTAPTFPNYYDDANSAFYQCCSSPLPTNGSGNIANAPLFVNPAGGNFRLQSNSPCINAGSNGYVSTLTDLDGRPRIVGGTADIGAYESQGAGMGEFIGWLQQFGLPTDGSADFADADADRMNNWQEWRAGTNPTNALSKLLVLSPASTNANIVVTWQSVTNITYYLQRATNLNSQPAFLPLGTNIAGQSGTTSFTDTNAPGPGPFFYRVGVQ